MTYSLRRATQNDLFVVLPRTRALQAHEGIAIDDARLVAALNILLLDTDVGSVWLVENDGAVIGYAIVSDGWDLEFGGHDAYLTELWIDEPARGRGAGTAALALLESELRARGVRALHLQVRPDNPAVRLYERAGFARVPRWIMSRRLS